MLHVSALASREIRALLLALKQAEPEIRKETNKQAKLAVTQLWQQEIAEMASLAGGKNQKARFKLLVKTAKATVGSKGITLTAATIGRPLTGGLQPKSQWHVLEFGGDKRVRSYSATSKRGRSYKVTRDVNAHLDKRNKKGYTFYPAVREALPRIMSLWMQTAVRTLVEVVEKR